MKNKMLVNVVLLGLVILPALETHTNTAPGHLVTSERIAQSIKAAADDGRYFTVVNFRDKSWKEENEFMALLRKQGYKVDYIRDKNVYGFNPINGALKINW